MPKKLSERFKTEREHICNELIKILELGENNTFLLSELDANIEKQEKILAMSSEISKFFCIGKMFALKGTTKRDYLNMVRSTLKQQGYVFINHDFNYKENNIQKKTVQYLILFPDKIKF